MAQIELRIVAESAEELQNVIAGLADGSIEPTATGVSAEAETPRRGRGRPAGSRNKPRETDTTIAPTAGPGSGEVPESSAGAPATPSEPAASAAPAPPAAAPEAPAASPPAEGGPTAADVRARLQAIVKKFADADGNPTPAGQDKAIGVLTDLGAKSITALDPAKYADAIKAADAILATKTDLV